MRIWGMKKVELGFWSLKDGHENENLKMLSFHENEG
jgi:hypothetical protein